MLKYVKHYSYILISSMYVSVIFNMSCILPPLLLVFKILIKVRKSKEQFFMVPQVKFPWIDSHVPSSWEDYANPWFTAEQRNQQRNSTF